ncbi:MAG: porin family protein [Capnocytophaga sp.]|uniref:porin family protein n=1 Tax=unclassified Capnocytophaga TaxID=2640652 RepID=UPI00280A751E|nr:porin family protein [Capnocytophaga sp.]MDU6660536.1 porin family protein [Capnocytophaga sp.]
MYRIITTIAVAFATITAVNAQEFKVGAKAGLLLSDLSTSDASIQTKEHNVLYLETTEISTAIKAGFHFGGFIEYGFNDRLFVEGGIDYSFQGAKVKSTKTTKLNLSSQDATYYEYKPDGASIRTQQLNIPLWVKYDIAGFRPKVGVNLGFLTKAELKAKSENGNSETLSLNPNKTFDFGLGLGAEYNLSFGLFFDATFNMGLTDVSTKEKTAEEFPALNFKNRVIQIGVGYKF